MVTGNTGFTGNWLVAWLSGLGAVVRGYSSEPTGLRTLFTKSTEDPFTHIARVENDDAFALAMKDFEPELIIHLAAQSLVIHGYKHPLETFRSNVLGTASVLDASLTARGLRGVLAITTDKVYSPSNVEHAETSTIWGHDPYSSSKVGSEAVISGYRPLLRDAGVEVVALRGGNIFGGGDWAENRIVPDYFRSWKNQSPLSLRHPHAVRPWQHVLDLCFGYLVVGAHILTGKNAVAEAYNIGPASREHLTVLDLVQLFSLDVEVSFESSNVGAETTFLALDSSNIQESLGWRQTLDIKESIQMTQDWYVSVMDGLSSPIEITKQQIESFERIASGGSL